MRVITLGFATDPIARWIWPDAKVYLEAMPKFIAAFAGRAFDRGTAWHTDGHQAAALWLRPGTESDADGVMALLEETLPPEIAQDAASFFEQMDRFHPHDESCWYLPMIAADPAHQGRGLGSALLKHALWQCDEEGMIAYLESSNPRNISLYERHGFDVIGEIQAGSSPVMYPMIREVRRWI